MSFVFLVIKALTYIKHAFKKGGYNLSFYITAMNALDTKDYQAIEGLMHEDFIWMNGYEMKTLDEWLEGLREEFKRTLRLMKELVFLKTKTFVLINTLLLMKKALAFV